MALDRPRPRSALLPYILTHSSLVILTLTLLLLVLAHRPAAKEKHARGSFTAIIVILLRDLWTIYVFVSCVRRAISDALLGLEWCIILYRLTCN